MRITDLLQKQSIDLAGSASGKTEVIDKLVSLIEKSGVIRDSNTYRG